MEALFQCSIVKKVIAILPCILFLIVLFVKSRKVSVIMFKWLSNLVLRSYKGVHELDKLGPIDKDQMTLLRKEEGVIVVDDSDSGVIAKTLKDRFGFHNVLPLDVFPCDDLIQKYHIIVTDVRLEGEDPKSNGLKLAGNLKKQYPNKQIIVISGQLRTNRYTEDRRLLATVDGYYDKNKDSIEKLSEILNKSIIELNHPAHVWRNLRDQMLHPTVGGEQDKALVDVMRLEDLYVRSCLKVFTQGGLNQKEWKEKVLAKLRVVKEAAGLILNLQKIFETISKT